MVLIAGLSALLALPACGTEDLLASRDQIEVEAGFRTDAASYRMSSGSVAASISISLENRFGTPLLPVPCTEESPEWTLERLVGERWEAVATGACLLASWALVTVSPGSTYRGVIRLTAAVEPGTYRLVMGLLEVTDDATRPVVDGRARSNTFLLTD
jgi:hypothetical protein